MSAVVHCLSVNEITQKDPDLQYSKSGVGESFRKRLLNLNLK